MHHRPAADLFLISWLVLFLELACIRWFPSHVLFLTFFVNLVLLACFVGMSVGCLVASRPTNFIRFTPYWLLVGLGLGLVTDLNSEHLKAVFAVGNPGKPEVVYFGTESLLLFKNPLPFTVPMELVGALFFVLIAGIMVGPGQEMGRAFNRVPSRTAAYSANLLGSLVGIGTFALCSVLRLPPIVWFGLTGAVLAYWIVRKSLAPAAAAPAPRSNAAPLALLTVAVALTFVTSGLVTVLGRDTIWSEYYRIDSYPATKDEPNHRINTNLISQQLMEPRDHPPVAAVAYALPYLFQRDLQSDDGSPAWKPFKRILIIGAGNGNDVARALLWADPDAKIDAVEIDPVIQKLGEKYHPDRPFQDPRVTAHINDGRNFLRDAKPETYDLVVFALIDSLVLQSGYSNLRLESYLFTLESFQDVRRVLKPTGVYTVYNFFRQPWIAARIRDQLRDAFGGIEPVVITTPPTDAIRFSDPLNAGMCTGFFAGAPGVVDPLRQAFVPRPKTGILIDAVRPLNPAPIRYWYPWFTGVPKDTRAGFGPTAPTEPPAPSLRKALRVKYQIGADGKETDQPVLDAAGNPLTEEVAPMWLGLEPAQIEESNGALRQAKDSWPFLYTREQRVPSQTWVSVALTLLLSFVLWVAFGGPKALGPDAATKPDYQGMLRAFFLGAGFMLVETKAVVEMALLFGGTWMVNTAVFAAILVMSLAGNLFAGRVNPKRLEPYYIGLVIALGVGLVVSPSAFLGLPPAVQVIGACALVFTPIAFAGVIFATSFKRTAQPDRVFGANVAGALVGGLAENSSVVLGFQLLLCVAVGFYALSALFGNDEPPAGAAERGV